MSTTAQQPARSASRIGPQEIPEQVEDDTKQTNGFKISANTNFVVNIGMVTVAVGGIWYAAITFNDMRHAFKDLQRDMADERRERERDRATAEVERQERRAWEKRTSERLNALERRLQLDK